MLSVFEKVIFLPHNSGSELSFHIFLKLCYIRNSAIMNHVVKMFLYNCKTCYTAKHSYQISAITLVALIIDTFSLRFHQTGNLPMHA